MTCHMNKSIVIFFLLIFYLSEGVVILDLCGVHVAGSACTLKCTVPNFEKDITFNHLPPRSVGTCLKGSSTCKSRYNYTIEKDVNANKVYLEIKKLEQKKHSGNWSCSYGLEESKAKYLHVYELQLFTKPTLYVSATENSNLILLCDLNSNKQSHSIDWYYNGTKVYKTDRHTIDSYDPAALTINPVLFPDSGVYRCSMAVAEGNANVMYGPYISVTVSKNVQKDQHMTVVTLLLSVVLAFVVIVAAILSYHIYRLCLKQGKGNTDNEVQKETKSMLLGIAGHASKYVEETQSPLLEDETVIGDKTTERTDTPSGTEKAKGEIKTDAITDYSLSSYTAPSGYSRYPRQYINRDMSPYVYSERYRSSNLY